MKVKRIVALVVALTMVLALSSVALAVPSPIGSNVIETSGNVEKVEVKTISEVALTELSAAANDYIASQFGSNYVADTLLAMDLVVTRTDNNPVTLSLNVSGVKVGDIILVIHEKEDGSKEVIPAQVLANGVIKFTLTSFSPISIVKVAHKSATGINAGVTVGAPTYAPATVPTMPQTGDDSISAVAMVMLLAALVAIVVVSGKALKAK